MGIFLENLTNQSEYRWGSKIIKLFKKFFENYSNQNVTSVVGGEEVDLVADRYRFRHIGRR